ncbi:hypothetical protein AB6A40_001656 [Gnathostoma spinigerum]|uniref:Uncharacterized protein n=1 Tax=Gnathostoma spinigerum TaxID=75299 RepID=A0ABD6EEK4_9BILA
MWLPRLMRAANEEQELRAAAAAAVASHIRTHSCDIGICESGRLPSCNCVVPPTVYLHVPVTLKDRYILVRWCCAVFLALILALIFFSGLLTSSSSEFSSENFSLIILIAVTCAAVSVAFCCMKARHKYDDEHYYHNGCLTNHHSSSQPFALPTAFFTMHSMDSMRHHVDRSSFAPVGLPNSVLDSCCSNRSPLPSYNEAIKEPMSAPPSYPTAMALCAASPDYSTVVSRTIGDSSAPQDRIEHEVEPLIISDAVISTEVTSSSCTTVNDQSCSVTSSDIPPSQNPAADENSLSGKN